MSTDLQGTKVAFLVANEGVEQVELTEPWQALLDVGAEPVLVAPKVGDVQAFDHLDKADVFQATVAAEAVDVEEYAALVLPGGVANPDQLRTEAAAVHLVQDVVRAGRPIAAICHAPWTLIEAEVVSGRTLTRPSLAPAPRRKWRRSRSIDMPAVRSLRYTPALAVFRTSVSMSVPSTSPAHSASCSTMAIDQASSPVEQALLQQPSGAPRFFARACAWASSRPKWCGSRKNAVRLVVSALTNASRSSEPSRCTSAR